MSRSITRRTSQALVLLVGGDVAQLGQRLQLLDQPRRPLRQLLRVGVFEAVLVLRAADAVFHRQVLHRLHVERDALDLGQLGLQAPDDVAGDRPSARPAASG